MARNHSHQGKRKKSKKGGKRKTTAVAKMARGADKHRLYEESVQEVESDVQMMDRVFKKRYGRLPSRMREEKVAGSMTTACTSARRAPTASSA